MIMISMPMGNDPNWRKRYKEIATNLTAKGYDVSPLSYKELYGRREPNLVEGLEVQNVPLLYMAHSFIRMSLCDTIYFARGWENARGCCLEHQAAKNYGLKIIYEVPESPCKKCGAAKDGSCCGCPEEREWREKYEN